jgi:hypothetical protein
MTARVACKSAVHFSTSFSTTSGCATHTRGGTARSGSAKEAKMPKIKAAVSELSHTEQL